MHVSPRVTRPSPSSVVPCVRQGVSTFIQSRPLVPGGARPVLAAALCTCRKDDVLVVWKLDRLGRNTKHLLEIVEDLTQGGVGLKTLTGYAIDTSTLHGKLALHMFAALAEYELALIQ